MRAVVVNLWPCRGRQIRMQKSSAAANLRRRAPIPRPPIGRTRGRQRAAVRGQPSSWWRATPSRLALGSRLWPAPGATRNDLVVPVALVAPLTQLLGTRSRVHAPLCGLSFRHRRPPRPSGPARSSRQLSQEARDAKPPANWFGRLFGHVRRTGWFGPGRACARRLPAASCRQRQLQKPTGACH